MEDGSFWNDPVVSQNKMKTLKSLKDDVATYEKLATQFEDIETLIEMGYEENDASLIPEIEEMLSEFVTTFDNIRIKTLLSGEYDGDNAILSLHAGAGGTESCDWAQMLFRMYSKWADILILYEPTAVLTPQETEKLFAVLRNMRKAGKSIIIITHKLNEVLELSDRVAVLRKGKYINTVETAKATVESLTEMMVGEKVKLDINRTEPVGAEKRIEMRGITCKNKEGLKVLTEASFTAYSGEILGVAGISGSGQKELLESVAGLQPIESGEILYFSPEGTTEKISEMKAEDIKNLGITLSFVPEDRLGMGLVGSMDLTDNMMIRSYKEGSHFFADRKSPKKLAEDIVEKLDVVTPGVDTPVSRLSGGNVQKILVGREIAGNPTVLMVAYPVRGLDINSSYTIYNLLNDQKKKGVAVICVGEDLDVLLELCDKILVLNSGKVAGIVDARTTTKEKLGLMMTGLTEDKNE